MGQVFPALDRNHRGRLRAAFRLMALSLLVWGAAPRGACAETPVPEVVVTDLLVDARADVDAAFLADGGRELAAAAAARLPGLLAANPGWRVHPDFLAEPARSVGSLERAGERVWCRGVLTRVDEASTGLFGDLRLLTYSVGLRLEFFDIRTGQIWFGQGVTARLPVETATTPGGEARRGFFRDALDAALVEAAARAGRAYRPGSLEATVLEVEPDGLLVLDRGTGQGLSAGAGGEIQAGETRWLVRVQEAEGGWCRVRVLASSGPGSPAAGAVARFSGVNGLLAVDGPPVAVAGVVLPDARRLDGAFDSDAATLGQWLHDALVDTRAFQLLPPLLAGPGSGSELAAAFFRAQSLFSAVGDTRQDEIIGHRSLPQLLARVVVTHTGQTSSTRLGYEARVLRLGLLLEIYDRRTHEVLLSQVHEAVRVEKHHEDYRRADLGAAWRELARDGLKELARLAAAGWNPGGRELPVVALESDGRLRLEGAAEPGERGVLRRPGAPVWNGAGREIGRRGVDIAMAAVEGVKPATARVTLGDGRNTAAVGDRLRLPANRPRPNARVRRVTLGGDKLEADWTPDTLQVALWAHQALAGGPFNLLAPDVLSAEVAAAEVAMAGGEFLAVPVGEILLAEEPAPRIWVDVRVGLSRVERTATPYKAELRFVTGVELSFFDEGNQPLAWFTDDKGAPTHKRRAMYGLPGNQVLVDGRVVQGVPEGEYPDMLDESLRACLGEAGKSVAKGEGS